jgi:6-pyruvoyltetrahydropterin/6-carboxytetrahydropterin synthase
MIKKRNKVVRVGKFDAGHRVMNERFKCFNVHGHEYKYELHFNYKSELEIGYAIDFKEIKRVAMQFIDDVFDHGFLVNPKDVVLIDTLKRLNSKTYIMNLVDKEGYCNPTAENIAKEMFFMVNFLLGDKNLKLEKIVLHETINCFVECEGLSFKEKKLLKQSPLMQVLKNYKKNIGIVEYDDRKLTCKK